MTAEAAAKLDPEEFYRTDNMALVTYLKMHGHTAQVVEWHGATCFWNFRITDGLLECTEVFFEGGAQVEPQEYSRKYRETRKEFFDSKSDSRR